VQCVAGNSTAQQQECVRSVSLSYSVGVALRLFGVCFASIDRTQACLARATVGNTCVGSYVT
jgi:hypothetical protein